MADEYRHIFDERLRLRDAIRLRIPEPRALCGISLYLKEGEVGAQIDAPDCPDCLMLNGE